MFIYVGNMDPLDTFEVPYDTSDEWDTVIRALSATRVPNTIRLARAPQQPLNDAMADVSIYYAPPKQARQARIASASGNTNKKRGYIKNGKWRPVNPNKPKPKEFLLFYVGYRGKKIPNTIGFTEEGSVAAPPVDDGWVSQRSADYPYQSQAIRNFLLEFMAPELRQKPPKRMEEKDEELAKIFRQSNYKVHNAKLAPFEPLAQFVAVFDPAAAKLTVYKVTIALCKPTKYYDFPHYKLENPQIFLAAPRINSEAEAQDWINNNITYYARRNV